MSMTPICFITPGISGDTSNIIELKKGTRRSHNLGATLITKTLLEELDTMQNSSNRDKKMAVLIKLVIALIKGVKTALDTAEYTKFDGNAGDFGCEKQAVNIFTAVSSEEIQEEFKSLVDKSQAVISEKIHQKFQSLVDKSQTAASFKKLGELPVSDEAAYLLRAHLLTVTKQEKGEGYETHFITDINKLELLVKNIGKNDTFNMRKQIVFAAQTELSSSSIDYLKAKVLELSLIEEQKKIFLVKMLSGESIVTRIDEVDQVKSSMQNSQVKYPYKGSVKKFFSCCFYNVVAVLEIAKEKRMPIVMKRWKRLEDDKPLLLLLQSPKAGAPCSFLSQAETAKLDPTKPVIVMQGRIPKEYAAESVQSMTEELGFETLILTNSAQVGQFGPQSSLADIKDEFAQNQIRQYQQMAGEINALKDKAFFFLDHVYCSTLKLERNTIQKEGKK